MVTDASFWVAVFVEGDAYYADAIECLERALECEQALHAPALALAEVGGAIARRTGDRQAADIAIEYLQSKPWITIHHGSEVLSRSAARVAVECMLRGADATYVALAEHIRLPLITLDKEMYERAPTGIRVLTPREWVRQFAAPPKR